MILQTAGDKLSCRFGWRRLGEVLGDLLQVLDGIVNEGTEGSIFAAGDEAGRHAAEVGEPGIEAGLEAGNFGGGEDIDILLGFAELGAQAGDGLANACGVFGEDGDHFAGDLEAVVVDLQLEVTVGLGRDGDDVGEAEVGVAELLAIADDALDALVSEAGVFQAILLPGEAEELVVAGFPDVFEGFGLFDGAFKGDGAEGLAAADGSSEGHVLSDVFVCHVRIFFLISR